MSLSTKNNYLDVDDLIAENYCYTVCFKKHIKNLGHLIPGNSDIDIPIGTKHDLPYWSMMCLLDKRSGFDDDKILLVTMPKPFTTIYRNIFIADANVINFQQLLPLFYRLGIKTLKLFPKNSPMINELLLTMLNVFRQRHTKIYNSALCGDDSIENNFINTADDCEIILYTMGYKAAKKYHQWMIGSSKEIKSLV